MSWPELEEWWMTELDADPAYEAVVTPLLIEVLVPQPDAIYLDLGCGEGRVMRVVAGGGARVIGLDLNLGLAARARPSVVARLPLIPFDQGVLDGAYAVLVLEHIAEIEELFREVARVVRRDGTLALVINHPLWTAPGSTPISDSEGELLWRPGEYFGTDSTEAVAGQHTVTFHHRSLADLLTMAATAGWSLEKLIERSHSDAGHVPDAVLSPGVPRLLACRWRLAD